MPSLLIDDLLDREYFGIKLGLGKIRRVLKQLDHPERRFASLHVAGTLGKGSTATMMARILGAAGYKVGLFTSPHLEHVTERFQINGKPIRIETLNQLVARIALVDRGGAARLSFFEVMTAVAFLYFAEAAVDYAVVEVGMGGRLDATNVLQPLVSVVTPIARDHERHLGKRLDQIAPEKAGIIKRGVPVISAPQRRVVRKILQEKAHDQKAPLQFVSEPRRESDGRFHTEAFHDLWVPSLGDFQASNAAVAVRAVQALATATIPRRAYYRGLEASFIPGRLEIASRRPLILLDVAHNPDAVRSLVASSRPLLKGRRVHCLFGAMADKDVRGMLKALSPLQAMLHVTTPRLQRALPVEQLTQLATRTGFQVRAHADVAQALDTLRAELDGGDALLVAGSLFLVGEAKSHLNVQEAAA